MDKNHRWRTMVIGVLLLVMIGALSACGQKNYPFDTQHGGSTPDSNKAPSTQGNGDEPPSAPAPITPEQFIHHYQQQEYATLYEHMSMEMRDALSLADLIAISESFNRGVTSYHLAGKFPIDGFYKYSWLDDTGTKSVSIYLDADDRIAGMWIYPVITYPETDAVWTENEYTLPFVGEWFTFWGGTNEIVNYHYAIPEQRYAFDFVAMKNDVTHLGDGKQNEDYYAFGRDVFAPADGIVVAIEADIVDNVPGVMDPYHPLGNYVVLDHGNDEYSLVAHLQQHSVLVAVGDVVSRGEQIGQSGNSGNSSEPHIHFQVMNGPHVETAQSIRIRIAGYEQIVQGDYVIGNSR